MDGRTRYLVLALAVATVVGVLGLALSRGDRDGPPPVTQPTGRAPAALPAGPGYYAPPGQTPAAPTTAAPTPAVATSAAPEPEDPTDEPAADPTGIPTPPAEPLHDDRDLVGSETLDPAALRQALAVADRFAGIWVSAAPDWYDRLAELSTPALAAALAGADPPQPAPELTGRGRVLFESPAWARITVPADRGTVVLDVVDVDGEWLVSAVDWRTS